MKQEIVDTIKNLFSSVDKRDWPEVEGIFDDQTIMDYTSLNGGKPQTMSPKEIISGWQSMLPGFERTHHSVDNFQLYEHENSISVHYDGRGDHFMGKEFWSAVGTFDTDLAQEGSLWKITKHRFNLVRQEGDETLPGKAKQVVIRGRHNPSRRKISFDVDGTRVVGNLYFPADADTHGLTPAILVGGSWTTVKEQMSGLYAEELARQGFVALAIDPRYYGESEGHPRFWENPAAKIEDYEQALTFLRTVDGVDPERVSMVAVCASAGYMANVAITDGRLLAFATVAAWLHDAESVKILYGGDEGVSGKLRKAERAKTHLEQEGVVEYVPTVSETDTNAAMAGNFPYYLDKNRGAIPEWSADKFAIISWQDWLTFDPMPTARKITIPTLMVHSDEAALPDNAKRFFSELNSGSKIIFWTEGSQFDFYDQPKQVSEAVAAISVFIRDQAAKAGTPLSDLAMSH